MKPNVARFSGIVVLGLLLVIAATGLGQTPSDDIPRAMPADVGMSAAKLDVVKSVVQASLDKKRTAGVVVLIARRGKVVRLEAFGQMDSQTGKEMRTDAIFRIYSMTKPITTVAALILVEEGKIKLDDPVSKYLPEFKGLRVYGDKPGTTVEPRREMTILDLMRHTSGLTYDSPTGGPVGLMYANSHIDGGTSADMVSRLSKLPLQFQPGTRFNYSVSTDVLGRVIEVVSCKPLDEFMRQRIFVPLDMRDTDFFVPKAKMDRLTANYQMDGGTLKETDHPASSRYLNHPTFLSGGGGLVSTARNYFRFCQMLLNGGEMDGKRLLLPRSVNMMTTNQLPPEALPITLGGFPLPGCGIGLGTLVRMEGQTPRPTDGEYSWYGAASTCFWVAPKTQLVVVLLQQVEPISVELQMALKPVIEATIQ